MSTKPLEAISVECPRCKAVPGSWCVTPSGGRSRKLHENRFGYRDHLNRMDPDADEGTLDPNDDFARKVAQQEEDERDVSLLTVNVGLSLRAFDLLEEALYEFHEGDLALREKVLAELRYAREVTTAPSTAQSANGTALERHERRVRPSREGVAAEVAAKMAKAARKAAEGADDAE